LSEEGVSIAKNVSESIAGIDSQTKKVSELLDEISEATNEQSHGVEQIFKAITQMELVIQSNALTAEDSAASAEELLAQTMAMNEIVNKLTDLVNGSNQTYGQQGFQQTPSLPGSKQKLLSSENDNW